MKIHNLKNLNYLSFKYHFDTHLIYSLEDMDNGANLFLSYFFNEDFSNIAMMIEDGIDISQFTIAAPLSRISTNVVVSSFPPLVFEGLSTTALNYVLYLGYKYQLSSPPLAGYNYLHSHLSPFLIYLNDNKLLGKLFSQQDSCKKTAWDYIFNFPNPILFDFLATQNILEASFFNTLSSSKLEEYLHLSKYKLVDTNLEEDTGKNQHINILQSLLDDRQMKTDLGDKLLPLNSTKAIVKF